MSFDLEKLKNDLNNFGNIYHIDADEDRLEFIVIEVSFMTILNNFGVVVLNDILPFYKNINVLSLDKIRLKCSFSK